MALPQLKGGLASFTDEPNLTLLTDGEGIVFSSYEEVALKMLRFGWFLGSWVGVMKDNKV